ncbi:unnamed protein product [Mycena citricolor]|uniref:Uncharacterized protein n=1 Tax=Mycena citricolor TaxID=2018698 RepID=A0AAD2Q271_9AGAR|nr:unnamed protein product [Mycena citricolor]
MSAAAPILPSDTTAKIFTSDSLPQASEKTSSSSVTSYIVTFVAMAVLALPFVAKALRRHQASKKGKDKTRGKEDDKSQNGHSGEQSDRDSEQNGENSTTTQAEDSLTKSIEDQDAGASAGVHVSEASRDQTASLEAELQALHARLQAAETSLADAGKEKHALEAALAARVQELIETRAQLGEENTRLMAENREALDRAQRKEKELRESKAVLAAARLEDRLTDQAVLVLIQALNTEIEDTAAYLAQQFEFEPKSPSESEAGPAESEDMAEVYERTTEILGPAMVEILRVSDHSDDQTIIRIAFQGGMIEYSRWMSTSWFFEDPEDEQLLTDIYHRIRIGQDQATAGRWRALTLSHVQELIHGEPELGEYFVDAFVNVLLTAGFASDPSTLHELISARFADRILRLVRLALGLNKAIGAEVTACELKTLSATPGVAFDPETMRDAIVKSRAEPGETVLCTCELGLTRSDKTAAGGWTRRILLKPRVIMPSGLDHLLDSRQATPTKTEKEA